MLNKFLKLLGYIGIHLLVIIELLFVSFLIVSPFAYVTFIVFTFFVKKFFFEAVIISLIILAVTWIVLFIYTEVRTLDLRYGFKEKRKTKKQKKDKK